MRHFKLISNKGTLFMTLCNIEAARLMSEFWIKKGLNNYIVEEYE